MQDNELLKRYANEQDEKAFAELYQRYIALVYSACRRQLSSPIQVEEATQAVFILLANKSKKLIKHPSLAAWLLITTRYTCLDLQKRRHRQLRRETIYMNESSFHSSSEKGWQEIAPLLDQALLALPETDRFCLILKYFQNQELTEIATELNISYEAAKKRVVRALEKLEELLRKRGVRLASGALASLLVTNAINAVPSGLIQTGISAALVATIANTTSTSIWGVHALKTLLFMNIKTIGITAVVATTATLTATHVFHQENEKSSLSQMISKEEISVRNPVENFYQTNLEELAEKEKLKEQKAVSDKRLAELEEELRQTKKKLERKEREILVTSSIMNQFGNRLTQSAATNQEVSLEDEMLLQLGRENRELWEKGRKIDYKHATVGTPEYEAYKKFAEDLAEKAAKWMGDPKIVGQMIKFEKLLKDGNQEGVDVLTRVKTLMTAGSLDLEKWQIEQFSLFLRKAYSEGFNRKLFPIMENSTSNKEANALARQEIEKNVMNQIQGILMPQQRELFQQMKLTNFTWGLKDQPISFGN